MKRCIGHNVNIYLNVIKTAHRRSNFLKTLVSQEIFASVGLRKNLKAVLVREKWKRSDHFVSIYKTLRKTLQYAKKIYRNFMHTEIQLNSLRFILKVNMTF